MRFFANVPILKNIILNCHDIAEKLQSWPSTTITHWVTHSYCKGLTYSQYPNNSTKIIWYCYIEIHATHQSDFWTLPYNLYFGLQLYTSKNNKLKNTLVGLLTFLSGLIKILFYRDLCVIYLRNKSWKPECVLSFNMGWQILVFWLPWFILILICLRVQIRLYTLIGRR